MMRKIPLKNYILLLITAVVVVVVVWAMMHVYNVNKKVTYDSPVKDVVTEIKIDSLDYYLQENLNAIIYVYDSTNGDTAKESKIRDVIVENNLQSHVVYLEKTEDAIDRYKLDGNNPIFIAYQAGEIYEIFSREDYTHDDLTSFFVRIGAIEND